MTSNIPVENNSNKGELENNYVWKGPPIASSIEEQCKYGQKLLSAMQENSSLVGQIDAITGFEDTFENMASRSVRCALWMRKQNIKLGDVIGLCTGTHLNSIIPVVSSLFIGTIINPWWDNTNEEKLVLHFINLTQPKIIFATETEAKFIQQVIKNNKIEIEIKIVVFGKVKDLESFDEILASQSPEEVANFKCTEIPSPNQPAMILYTSGTTGNPKGALLPYKSFGHIRTLMPHTFMGKSVGINFSTVAWISGIVIPLEAIIAGSKAVIFYGIPEAESFKLIDKYQVNWITMGTGVANRLSKDPSFQNRTIPSVKHICFGGALVKRRIFEFLEKTFSSAYVYQCYGATELAGLALRTEREHHPDSCGRVMPDVEVKVISQDGGQTLGPNEEGELCIRSPTMMLGYHNNPEATAEALDALGWFHSGDLGKYNEDGEFFITDRIKELIKIRLYHVPPGPIENVIQSHPGVYEVAVVGKPDNDDVEQPIAFVVKASSVNVYQKEIIDLVDKRLPFRFKLLGGVQFVNDLPRTSSGKVAKNVLRQMARDLSQTH